MDCNSNYEIIGGTVVSIIVIISEALPLVKYVKSNGIFHALYQFYKTYIKTIRNVQTTEEAPLLEEDTPRVDEYERSQCLDIAIQS